MRFRKLLLCALFSLIMVGMSSISAFAAETEETDLQTEDAGVEYESEIPEVDEETDEMIEADTSDTDKDTGKDTEAVELKESKELKIKKKSYTKAELRLLSALIFCEASSEPYAGKVAVGIVVVNRKESKNFPGTIKSVIYQRSQFGPARNGSLSKALSRYDNGTFTSSCDKDCIKAAIAALSGDKTVSYKGKTIDLSGFLYFSGRVSGAKLTIGTHQFK